MPFVDQGPLEVFTKPLPNRVAEDRPSFLGAALRQTEIASLFRLLQPDESTQYSPTFNDKFKVLAKQSRFFADFPDEFVGVGSENDFIRVEQALAARQQDRERTAAGGVSGFVTQMALGLLDPTILLPGGALVKGARTAATIGRSAASVAGWAVVGASANQMILRAADPTITKTDTAITIAASAVLGGILGGAVRALTPTQLERMARGMVEEPYTTAIQYEPPREGRSLSAAAGYETPVSRNVGKLAPSGGVGKVMARHNPILRGFQNESPQARYITAQFGDGGVALTSHAEGIASAKGGTIESGIALEYARFANVTQRAGKIFAERTDRSLGWQELKQLAGQAANRSGQSDVPEAAALAKLYQEELFVPLLERAKAQGVEGFEKIDPSVWWLHRMYRHGFARKNEQQAVEMFQESVGETLDKEFSRLAATTQDRIARNEQKAGDLSLKPGPAELLRAELNAALKALPERFDTGVIDTVEEVRAIRAKARAAKTKVKRHALQAEALKLKADQKGRLDAYYAAEFGIKDRLSTLNQTHGALASKQTRLLQQMEGLGNDQIATLQRAFKTASGLLARLATVSDADLEKGLVKLEAQLERVAEVVEKTEKDLGTLGKRPEIEHLVESDDVSSEAISLNQAKLRDELDRFTEVLQKLDDVREGNVIRRDAALEAIQESLDLLAARTNVVNSKRALRAAKLEELYAKIDPSDAAKRAAALRSKNTKLDQEFLARAAEAGVETGDGFSFNSAKAAATLAHRIVGHIIGDSGSSIGMRLTIAERGTFLKRALHMDATRVWSNGMKLEDLLETDIEKVGRHYIRSAAADLEVHRVFGTSNPLEKEAGGGYVSPQMKAYEADANALMDATKGIVDPAKQAKRQELLAENKRVFIRDLAGLTDRVRHMRGLPADASGWAFRMGRAALDLNTVRLMGKPVISSIPDIARHITKYGAINAFRHGLLPLITEFQTMKPFIHELRMANVGTDLMMHGNTTMLNDVFDDLERNSLPERMLAYGANRMSRVNLMDFWNTQQESFAGVLANAQIMDSINVLRDGGSAKAVQRATVMLARVNIDRDAIEAIERELARDGGSSMTASGVRLPNMVNWEDQNAARLYRTALFQSVNNTIIAGNLDRPLAADANILARLFFQFQSFNNIAVSRIIVASAQDVRAGHYARVGMGVTSALALGMLSYYINAWIVGGPTLEKMQNASFAKFVDEGIDRSGLLAIFAQPRKALSHTQVGQYLGFSGEPSTASGFGSGLAEALGPTGDLAERGLNILSDALGRRFDKSTVKDFRAITPYQNLMGFSRVVDAIQEAFTP